jgi:hypothetical protein
MIHEGKFGTDKFTNIERRTEKRNMNQNTGRMWYNTMPVSVPLGRTLMMSIAWLRRFKACAIWQRNLYVSRFKEESTEMLEVNINYVWLVLFHRIS